MMFTTVENTMLYCPKCQQTYQDGVQRFCLNDGGRLLPAPTSGNSANQSGGVFTNVVKRKNKEENDEFADAPRFSQIAFRPPSGKFFKSESKVNLPANIEPELELELEIEPLESKEPPPNVETQKEIELDLPEVKPASRVVRQNEIAGGQALLGDRKANPTGRIALTWENPQVLLKQTVKGRYYIIEKTGEDEAGINYLAEDRIVMNKKVVVRVLMDEDTDDTFIRNIFAEERISLSHINHPNIVSVIDSGELSEGKPFVVTEYIKGKSVREHLQEAGTFDTLRLARIVRQASYALSEVHQSGILHRNLKPENIILSINEVGAEQVKLVNFGASKGVLNEKNLPYKSPEQVAGKLANFASDEYTLAVIAYQMLTNHLPFGATKIGSLLKEQREGSIVRATSLRGDLPSSVDGVLEKALSFTASERYSKVRDFGDALYNALTGVNLEEEAVVSASGEVNEVNIEATKPIPMPAQPPTAKAKEALPEKVVQTVTLLPVKAESANSGVKATEDLAWEKRSIEPPIENGTGRTMLPLLGLGVLLIGILGVWYYFVNRPSEPEFIPQTPVQSVVPIDQPMNNLPTPNFNNASAPTPLEIESFPMPRTVLQPPNTVYFQNSKDNLSGDAAKNFLGFSLYYPQSWTRRDAKNNFLDVSNSTSNGLPIEQMLVSYYDSKGTFKSDEELFPKLVEKSNADLKKALQGNYKIISQGETKIQNGRWQAYEVKFESSGVAADGEKVTLWGRRLWIPVQMNGLKNGFVITMLATSLSKEVTSVDDLGLKGELSGILETFEPNQNF